MVPVLTIKIVPKWTEVEPVRRQSVAFLDGHGLDAETVEALAMVASELTENAIKYGSYSGENRPAIEVSLAVSRRTITVEVCNPIAAEGTEEQLFRLDRMIQWIRGYHDPFQAYTERLRLVSAQRLENTESGLGLVRIAYEGQAILDFYVDEHDHLAVSAVHRRGAAR